MFALGDGKMVNYRDAKIRKAEKPHPVQPASSPSKVDKPSSTTTSFKRRKESSLESSTTSSVDNTTTIVSQPSHNTTVDLNQVSAAQLLSALNQKGYKIMKDFSQLTAMEVDVSERNNDNVIDAIGQKKSFNARDAVKHNTLSRNQQKESNGQRSEIVFIMTMSYGPQPIKDFSGDRRTDAALVVQAKNYYKY